MSGSGYCHDYCSDPNLPFLYRVTCTRVGLFEAHAATLNILKRGVEEGSRKVDVVCTKV